MENGRCGEMKGRLALEGSEQGLKQGLRETREQTVTDGFSLKLRHYKIQKKNADAFTKALLLSAWSGQNSTGYL